MFVSLGFSIREYQHRLSKLERSVQSKTKGERKMKLSITERKERSTRIMKSYTVDSENSKIDGNLA